MTNHPLTDELCKELSVYPIEEFAAQIADGTMTDIRTAADWQLEQDIEFFKNFLVVSLGIPSTTADLMAQDFKAAMRPQEES